MLDSNAYCDWRRIGRWNRWISTADEVLVPAVVLGELLYGFEGSARAAANEAALARFLRHPSVRVVEVGASPSRCYAYLKFYLRAQGTPTPDNDIWIAPLALEQAATLVTSDTHFVHLPQVSRMVVE